MPSWAKISIDSIMKSNILSTPVYDGTNLFYYLEMIERFYFIISKTFLDFLGAKEVESLFFLDLLQTHGIQLIHSFQMP